ncbi:hypothetical protein F2Q69_00048617 [Brassica cretica]|uniref:Uncharacterized protein n=1 Tax=Brassica cretica TaxID=69181 RepID=A0A8S9PHJ2_BRACR|nr:hypothetical protein F2Q69_00048617 [Brassica cretica]
MRRVLRTSSSDHQDMPFDNLLMTHIYTNVQCPVSKDVASLGIVSFAETRSVVYLSHTLETLLATVCSHRCFFSGNLSVTQRHDPQRASPDTGCCSNLTHDECVHSVIIVCYTLSHGSVFLDPIQTVISAQIQNVLASCSKMSVLHLGVS